jgi:hypothetical protein
VDWHEAAYIVATRLDRLRNFAADVSAESVKGGYEPEADWIAKMVVVAAFAARARGSAGRGDHGYLTTDQFAAIADR